MGKSIIWKMRGDNVKINRKDLLLYAVTDRSWLKEETLSSRVELALKGGTTIVQLREKHLDDEAFLKEAQEIQVLCRKYHVPFIVNDNVEIAIKAGADGVHVGKKDMEAGEVRKLLGPDKILGVSAQTVEQAILAEKNGADRNCQHDAFCGPPAVLIYGLCLFFRSVHCHSAFTHIFFLLMISHASHSRRASRGMVYR